MPRYYRRRYTRVVKPKKKWATNMASLSDTYSGGVSPFVFLSKVLVRNSTESGNPTPVVVKCGNFKVQMDISYVAASGTPVTIFAYVVFVPEGVSYGTVESINNILHYHPEWVLAWKYASLDYTAANAQSGTQTLQFSSRLKRNLNSGDSVIIATVGNSTNNVNITGFHVGGLAQYWTCAN